MERSNRNHKFDMEEEQSIHLLLKERPFPFDKVEEALSSNKTNLMISNLCLKELNVMTSCLRITVQKENCQKILMQKLLI